MCPVNRDTTPSRDMVHIRVIPAQIAVLVSCLSKVTAKPQFHTDCLPLSTCKVLLSSS